jgi:GT2 family glycosyltransferase
VGIRAARSDLVFLLDHDLYPAADCLRRLLAAREERSCPVLAPRILLFPEKDVVQADGGDAHFLGTLALRNGHVPVGRAEARAGVLGASLWGCVLAERASVLGAGGFDEEYFFHFEDLEMSLRLRESGAEIRCEPSAVACHDRGAGSPGLAFRGAGEYPSRRAYLIMRNRLLTIFAHYRARTLLLLGPALFLYECASFAGACRKGFPGAWVRAWGWLLAHGGEVRARRRRMRQRRTVPDRLILSGGPIPLAPGFLRSRWEIAAAGVLSAVLNGYWRLARRWIG